MITIPEDQPPDTGNPALNEWLFRLITSINAALGLVPDFSPTGVDPTKVQNGMVRYFDANFFPGIVAPGPYMYIEGAWKALHLPDMVPSATPPLGVFGTYFYASVPILPDFPAVGPYINVEGVWKAIFP